MAGVFCTKCGKRNDSSVAVCPSCGAPLRVAKPAEPASPASGPRRRRVWIGVIVGVIATALVVAGFIVDLTRGQEGPTTSVDVFSGSWVRLPSTDPAFVGEDDQEMFAVASGGPGLVAVGYDGPAGGMDGAVWTSADGVVWSRLSDSVAFGGDGDQQMWSVTAGGPGVVAVGSDEMSAAVWTSADGVDWSRVPDEEGVLGGEDESILRGVVAGGPGLVAVGCDGGDAAVWTSTDGMTWTRVPSDEAVFGGSDNACMYSVAVGGPGLVAVGDDGPDGDKDAVVWTSVDGIAWSRVAHDEQAFGGAGTQQMRSVTAGGPGLVGVGYDESGGDADAAVWTSADGITWTRVPHDEELFGGEETQQMWSVTAGGPGLVAVGAGSGNAVVWTSTDGLSWTEVPYDDAVFGGEGRRVIRGVTVGGLGLVGAGFEGAVGTMDAAVWVLSLD
jgi:hypothetical protein